MQLDDTTTERHLRRGAPARRIRGTLVLTTALAGLLTLTGCATGTTDTPEMTTGASTTPSADTTSVTTGTPTPSTTPTAGASAGSGTTATGSAPGDGSSSAAGGTSGTGGSASAKCTTSQLSGATTTDVHTDSDVDVAVTLMNSSGAACTLQGWPGASVVGGGNGAQLGRAAGLDRSAPHPTVALAPKGAAHFTIRIVRPASVSNAECHPRVADGFRVIPPGETHSLFVDAPGYVACAADIPTLLTVTALLPGPA
jgi:hypothetical protein